MILGSGIDLVEVARFERESARRGQDLVDEAFTPFERRQWRGVAGPWRGFAMGWAAKEACWKALGTGKVGAMAWHDIEVRWRGGEPPDVALSGATAEEAAASGVTAIALSLSCTKTRAVAWAVVVGVRDSGFGIRRTARD